MPVGTRGAVKGITHRDLEDAGAEIILGNTYHLHLRPGDDLIARAGGLHAFIGWRKPILTDSGGYQVFSLAARRKVTEDSVTFRSHLDGALCVLTPEKATDIQAQLGSDIAMVLDELVGPEARGAIGEARGAGREPRGNGGGGENARAAMERSIRWAQRARTRLLQLRSDPKSAPEVILTNPGQAQFGIIQGGTDIALRTESVQRTVEVGFEAYAIGGLSVGEPVDVMYEVVGHTARQLPAARPRYLMGTGMPDDLVECVARGVDMFDCILPTRMGRTAMAFTSEGLLRLRNAKFSRDQGPLDPACGCPCCTRYIVSFGSPTLSPPIA
jgi:queuine tRNA-ribosyltransferase